MLRSQLLKGTTPLLIVSVLADEELYGYEIAQRIRERSGGTLAPSEGSLYPALHRLEQAGALEATWREGGQGPRRRYYRLTREGHAAPRELAPRMGFTHRDRDARRRRRAEPCMSARSFSPR